MENDSTVLDSYLQRCERTCLLSEENSSHHHIDIFVTVECCNTTEIHSFQERLLAQMTKSLK
jgi:hypothetical protein